MRSHSKTSADARVLQGFDHREREQAPPRYHLGGCIHATIRNVGALGRHAATRALTQQLAHLGERLFPCSIGDRRRVLMANVGKADAKRRKYGGKNMYWYRVRSIDGREQCEKFTVVSPGSTEKEIADRAEELFHEPC